MQPKLHFRKFYGIVNIFVGSIYVFFGFWLTGVMIGIGQITPVGNSWNDWREFILEISLLVAGVFYAISGFLLLRVTDDAYKKALVFLSLAIISGTCYCLHLLYELGLDVLVPVDLLIVIIIYIPSLVVFLSVGELVYLWRNSRSSRKEQPQ